MDRCLSNHDIEPYESIPSASDPVLPMSHFLPEFNFPNYNYHHNINYYELVDDFSRLQLSPPSLPFLHRSSIPSSSSFYPQERNSSSSGPFYIVCPFCNSYSNFLMPPRSPLVNEVREAIVSMAIELVGYKDFLSTGRPENIALIFSMVLSDVAAVMVDLHGSSLFQKLLEVCSHRQRLELFDAIVANINTLLEICCNDYGVMAMRSLINYCHTREQISSLMHVLGPYLFFLAKHEHGNRIVERCLRYFSDQLEKDLLNPLINNWEDLATHKFGCCILQQALDLAPRKDRDDVLAKIADKAFSLAQDSSGNYLLQYVLEKRIPHITFRMLQQLEGKFASLSTQKYSSNVVEECLKFTEEAESTRIINELFQNPNVLEILEDSYGNFVMQTALSVAKGGVLKDLVNVVMKHSASLRKSIYGRNVIESLNKRHICH